MKYKSLFMGILFLGAAASCTKDGVSQEGTQPEEEGIFTLSAELPQDTDVVKTALGNNYEIVWKTGNTVSINGTVSNAVAEKDNGERSVEFTFPSTPSSPYNVLYPGTTSTKNVVFPATQNYVANTFDDNAAPSYGVATVKGSKATAKLSPVNTVLRFALNGNSTVYKIVLNAVGGESLSGKYNVDFSTGAISANGNNSSSITYNINGDTGLELSGSDTYFNIVIPSRKYGSKGLEALVYEKNTEKYMRLTFGKNTTFNAGSLIQFVSKTYAAGRVEELAQINDFSSQAGGDPEKKASFTIANYNILSDYEGSRSDKAVLNLNNCGVQLGKCVKATGADIICFNEIDETFAGSSAKSIKNISEAQGLTGYEWYVANPNKVTSGTFSYSTEYSYANGYAFNPAVFERVEGNYYWFNKNGGYVGNRTDAYNSHLSKYRTLVYAKLRHKASGKTFNLIVTHMPNYNDENSDGALADGVAHSYAVTAINKFMEDKDASGNWLLCGDMNAYNGTKGNPGKNNTGYNTLLTKWTDSYEDMLEDGTLSDFYKKYCGTQSGTNYYYGVLQYTKDHPERRIDHIMYRGAFKAEAYKTIRLTYNYDDGTVHPDNESNDWCPSDHLPVVVKLILN